jgi:hypothetical protein
MGALCPTGIEASRPHMYKKQYRDLYPHVQAYSTLGSLYHVLVYRVSIIGSI